METKNKCNKLNTVTNILDNNSTISINTLHVNGLNAPNKRQRLSKE